MALVVQTNLSSLQAQKNLSSVQKGLNVSFSRLSSGYRINSAADDAAGLAISDNFTAQVRSFSVSERNANDGISMTQTAEGALGQITGLLTRMRELAVQSANGSQSSSDRGYLDTEYSELKAEIARIQANTKYDGQELISTDVNRTVEFQVGINNTENDRIGVVFSGISLNLTDTSVDGDVGDPSQPRAAIDSIDAALKTISTNRAKFGAAMNRFDTTISNIQTSRTNIAAANSRIRDVDVAEESAALSRSQVLSQAASSVLAQANQSPQLALSLMK